MFLPADGGHCAQAGPAARADPSAGARPALGSSLGLWRLVGRRERDSSRFNFSDRSRLWISLGTYVELPAKVFDAPS